MWARIKEWVGDLWGMTTTQILGVSALLGAVMADPTVGPFLVATFPFMPKVVAGVALLALIARWYAPPPPAVPVKKDDAMVVNHASGVITIAKAEDIPSDVISKAAGE